MYSLGSGVHRTVSAYGTCLFFCVIYHLTNSYVHSYPAKTGGNEDSVQIEKLRLISKRLTHLRQYLFVDKQTLTADTLSLIKSLTTSTRTAQTAAHKRDETGDPNESINPYRKQTRLEVLRRVYRQTGDPIGNFKNALADLLSFLTPFVQDAAQRLKPGTNRILLDINLIPSLLPLNDPAFSSGKIDDVLYKFYFMEQTILAVLQNLKDYILDSYKPWFDEQSINIEHQLNVAFFATVGLPFHGDFSQVSAMACGISCINTGVQHGMTYDTMVKIIDLVEYLVNNKGVTTAT